MNNIDKVVEELSVIKEFYEDVQPMRGGIDRAKAIGNAIQTIRELREDCNRYHEWGMHEGYEEAKEQIPKWHLVKIRPLTEEEKEYYGEDYDFIYDCETPDSDQEVLVATKWGVDKTTYCTDCGCYFENYEDEDEVIAWMELPKFDKGAE